MQASLARRLFRTILLIGLINVALTLIAVEFIYEDMEDTSLRLEMERERSFLEERIAGPEIQSWRSALHTALYVPDGQKPDVMPETFAGRQAPFSSEVELGKKTYLISVQRTKKWPGVLYLADDITLREDREDVLQVGLALLCFCMLVFGWLLARLGTSRIVTPLHRLTDQISALRPGTPFARIESRPDDDELARISTTLNQLLEALDAYVRREKRMVSMASHELRTPVAVIAGALDVLEHRASLGDADRRTVQRIRRAADDMQADVAALLKLSRRTADDDPWLPVDVANGLREVVAELESSAAEYAGRTELHISPDAGKPVADAALVRMLLRNLIQNALRHTRDKVVVRLEADYLGVSDLGGGLPGHVGARLADRDTREMPEEGLGLYIVQLICERLGWTLDAQSDGEAGTTLSVRYTEAGRGRDPTAAID
jgi:signal transduction histidine kinase